MDLKKYFDEHTCFGVRSTADKDGQEKAVVYALPSCRFEFTHPTTECLGAVFGHSGPIFGIDIAGNLWCARKH